MVYLGLFKLRRLRAFFISCFYKALDSVLGQPPVYVSGNLSHSCAKREKKIALQNSLVRWTSWKVISNEHTGVKTGIV